MRGQGWLGYRRMTPIPDSKAWRRERFAVWSAVGLIPVLLAGLLFLVVLSLVVSNWAPLRSFDTAAVDTFNAALDGRPLVVDALHLLTNLGGSETAWLLLPVAVVWLLVRRVPDLALYVAVTAIGSAILSFGTKELVERVRPVVDIPVASAAGHSFPSGHAMGATTTYGVLLLVFLPVIAQRWRRPLIGAAVFVVLLVGVTRVALGVHYPSDVLGGWLMGLLWLFVTASAFRRWEEADGVRQPLSMGLAPEERASLEPAPAHDSPLPRGWHSVSELLVVVVLIWAAMVGLGLLVTNLAVVGEIDLAVSEWFAAHRSETISDVAVPLGRLGSTVVIVATMVACIPLTAALTRRWAPALFLLLATTGETALYLAISNVVGRSRPSIERITQEGLPPAASFPSGHVAATVVTYGSITLLLLVWSRSRLRYAAPVLAVAAALAVALSRVYRGAHYPSDTLASILYASCWLAACWFIVQPWRGAHDDEHNSQSDPPVDAPDCRRVGR